MAGDPEELKRTLAELHGQLESAESIDPELRDPLRAVMEDIDALLDSSEAARGTSERHRSVVDRLSSMALRFETSHPTIAGTLNQLTHLLSSMGI